MNRCQFLTYTVAIAAAAPFAKLIQPSQDPVAAPLPLGTPDVPPIRWIPTQAEVDEWLTYYKIAVQQGVERFSDVVATILTGRPEHTHDLGTRFAATPQEAIDEERLFADAERAFEALHADRMAVAISQGAGYSAGRDGLPRENLRYTGPSHEAFGWYNMWAVGDRDRRGIRLPRSPGVTWPPGSRPRHHPYDVGRKA